MIQILSYEVVNGTKSDKILFERAVENRSELEDLRKELEKKNHCWETKRYSTEGNDFLGMEVKKVKEIMFKYLEK